MEKLVSGNPQKMFRCPYYWEEGGGQEGYHNVLIFYVLIMGGREGVQANKDNVLICALFFKASLRVNSFLRSMRTPSLMLAH